MTTRTGKRRRAGMAALVALGLQASAVAAQEAPDAPHGHASVLEAGPVHGMLVLPPSAMRPIGVVLVLHDALGPDQRSARYLDQLLGAGIAIVDTLRVGRDPPSLADLAAALGTEPRTQGLRIGLLGFGAGALAAARVEGAVAVRALLYPGCEGLELPTGAPPHPILLAHGDADAANRTDDCVAAASRLTQAGMAVRHRVYPDAGYAWDHPVYGMDQRIMLPRPVGSGRIAIAPWPELTALAASQVAAFFSAAFLAAPAAGLSP